MCECVNERYSTESIKIDWIERGKKRVIYKYKMKENCWENYTSPR